MGNDLTFLEVSRQEFWTVIDPHFQRIYALRHDSNPSQYYSDEEKERLKTLAINSAAMISLFILVKMGDDLVGWHFGSQFHVDSYYMTNSAVLEQYRGHGYYEKILIHVMGLIKSRGFQIIYSKHRANNPAILIPKLRQGFLITSTELDDRFGFLITLKYFANEQRQKAFGKMIGLSY